MTPGEYFIQDGDIELDKGRKTVTLSVANSGDRPYSGRLALSFLRNQPAVLPFRPQESAGHAARYPRPAPPYDLSPVKRAK